MAVSLKDIIKWASMRARSRRAVTFRAIFVLHPELRTLDLGSESGAAIALVLEGTPIKKENVYIADIEKGLLDDGERRFGFQGVLIPETGVLPFPDKYFDIVYCSSVIEHVTVNKSEVWSIRSGEEFRRQAGVRQRFFADEIRRLGRAYYVQTPNRRFPIESHSWLPFVAYFPRSVLIPLLSISNRVWIKKTEPDWNLLTGKELSSLFPGAMIIDEKVLGCTKSLMAVGGDKNLLRIAV
jgi:SAM-dependent methyltransferase